MGEYLTDFGCAPKFLMSSESTSAAEASSSELVTRVQNFLSENRKAVIIGAAAAVVAIGGAAYYASSSRTISTDVDSEKGEKKKDKKKTKSKKKKSAKDKDGPVLEERKSKAGDSKASSVSTGVFPSHLVGYHNRNVLQISPGYPRLKSRP